MLSFITNWLVLNEKTKYIKCEHNTKNYMEKQEKYYYIVLFGDYIQRDLI